MSDTSAADTTRATKKDPSNWKIYWKAFQSFEDFYGLCVGVFWAIAFYSICYVVGYVGLLCFATKTFAFFSGGVVVAGFGVLGAGFVLLMLGVAAFSMIDAFLERAKDIRERY